MAGISKNSGVLWNRPSGDETVTTTLCDEDLRLAGIVLDLLAQAIDVSLQRVRGDGRIVAPHLMQKRLARHRVAGAIEELEDIGFFFRQPDFLFRWIDQKLRAGAE